jgi:hypothetical protein
VFSEVRIAAVRHLWASRTRTGIPRGLSGLPYFFIIPPGCAIPLGCSWAGRDGVMSITAELSCTEVSRVARDRATLHTYLGWKRRGTRLGCSSPHEKGRCTGYVCRRVRRPHQGASQPHHLAAQGPAVGCCERTGSSGAGCGSRGGRGSSYVPAAYRLREALHQHKERLPLHQDDRRQ